MIIIMKDLNDCLWCQFIVAVLLVLICVCDGVSAKSDTAFCSFFNNRAPWPQPDLRNCTWFKTNSCCKQEEIDATFGTVKPLPGSTPECQR